MQKNRKTEVFSGAATALVTPFRADGSVDYAAFSRVLDMQKAARVGAVVVNGTTGEASCLTSKERDKNVAFTVEKGNGDFTVIAGTGSNSTARTVELTRSAARQGANAALVVLPYYNNPGEEGIVRHFYTVADASSVPIIAYDVPSRTGISLSPETAVKLAEHPNIVGLKEADGSISKATAIRAACGEKLTLYSGCDGAITPMLAIGGRGAITVTGNLFPNMTRMICNAYFEGDFALSARYQLALRPIIAELFAFVSPSPVKAAMAKFGIIENVLRLPLTALGESECKKLFSLCDGAVGEEKKCALQ